MSKIIGITGTIGSGKSTVGGILAEMGVPVIDTDRIVHELLTADTPVKQAVINRFGADIVADKPGAPIERQKLAAIIFQDERARKDLEKIVHPAVVTECRKCAQELAEEPIVAFLVPLLFEAGLEMEYGEIWTVFANETVLRQRLKERDKLSDQQINARLRAQLSQSDKMARSHRTIDNSHDIDDTREQVVLFVKELLSK